MEPEQPAGREDRSAQRRRDRAERHAALGWHPAILRVPADLEALEAAARSQDGEVLKPGPGARVLRIRLPDGRAAVLKHYPRTRALDPRDALGRSKAVRALLAAEALARRGFGVARPLAAWSRAGAGSWLLLEDLAGWAPLQEAAAAASGPRRARLLAAVARTVARLHAAGIAVRDLKPSNLLVAPEAGEPRLALIDHDRNWFLPCAVPLRLARRDLAALHAGLPPEVRASERLAALRAYDPRWLARPLWRRAVRPLLREAAGRRHRWIPRRLLAGGP